MPYCDLLSGANIVIKIKYSNKKNKIMSTENIKSENSKLSKLAVIHSYLEKPKFRAIVLLPPLALCIVGVIVAFAHSFSNFGFAILSFVQWTYFGGSIWLLLSIWLVLYSDYKRGKNNCH
jgi:hypothetical protein